MTSQRKIEHKYLAFVSVNFFERLYSSKQRLYLSKILFFLKILSKLF